MKINNLSNFKKKLILVTNDTIIIIISLVLAFSLRLEIIYPLWKIDFKILLLYVFVFLIVFYFFNIYKILVRYFDNFSIIKIIQATIFAQIFLIFINFLSYKMVYFPRSVSFIAPIIIGILVVMSRIIINYLVNSHKKHSKESGILIFGISNYTVSLLSNIRQIQFYGKVKGFVDTSGKFKKREINGIKIYKNENIKQIINDNSISEIIIGPNSLTKEKINNLFSDKDYNNIRINNLNNGDDNFLKNINTIDNKKINFYEIINRTETKINKNLIFKKIKNKNILITGGGGSIGSELAMQLINYKPKKIYILDSSEINLFKITEKLKKNKKDLKSIIPILGDCLDKKFLEFFFNKINLDMVYHTAAYKHVGFGQDNSYSMIKNNIIGTLNILDLSVNKKIKEFIFISTDKAVNPKSILGYSKKFCENIVSYYSKLNRNLTNMNFSIVRFGNVIGSSGSVIPIFINQLRNKQPLTVTHKKVERYFMSVEEAIKLIIYIGIIDKKRNLNIFALNMGKQIKIYEIAKRIIRLSGKILKSKKNPKGDVSIKITGLKKGEKISEEITLGKNMKKTSHPKIFLCEEYIDLKNMDLKIKKINNQINSKKISKFLEKSIIS